jgi:hypothetical protein
MCEFLVGLFHRQGIGNVLRIPNVQHLQTKQEGKGEP